jgi:histidine triad (HIT) family protein
MKDCPFCDTSTNNRVFSESKLVKVIFSNPRLVEGHLLVIPKRHIEEPWELDKQERDEVFHFINSLQKKISQTLGTGCDVRQNYRPFIIQGKLKIDHVHYHLIPRKFEDELYEKSQIYEKDIFGDLPNSEVDKVMSLLQDE